MKRPTFPDAVVVGMHFRGSFAKAWAEAVEIGTELSFEREPENPYDSSAIKILHNGEHVGYIERAQAAFIAPHLDEGALYRCAVTGIQNRKDGPHPITLWTPESALVEEAGTEQAT